MTITRKSLVAKAHGILSDAMDKAMKAPVRRGWSRLAGVSIPSKRDVLAAAKADLQMINQVAETFGYDPVWNDPDEQDVDLGSVD